MDSAKAQLADKLKTANNILVTVSRDPSVDQLSALLGLSLFLNKTGKHTAAVFSGHVPSTLEFLQPEETIEKNTDSLRDFIIALDKSKADKLRYKVEDNVVRIFITPYRTSISDADLEFSQGDFNVDVVVALGVKQQEDLDEAITAHGRILHDATVSSINISNDGGLGSINWHDEHASSLSELVTELVQAMDATLLDTQIATALLTGIVAETARFSNEKTSSQTMSASAALMAAGANQQLVATKLDEPEKPADDQDAKGNPGSQSSDPDGSKPDDGTIKIEHTDKSDESGDSDEPALELPPPQIIDEPNEEVEPPQDEQGLSAGPKLVVDPPTLSGTLTANSQPEGLDPSTDPLTLLNTEESPLLSRGTPQSTLPSTPTSDIPVVDVPVLTPQTDVPAPSVPAEPVLTPPPASWTPPPAAPAPTQAPAEPDTENRTLSELEASVGSSHAASSDLDDARDEVSRALSSSPTTPAPTPIQALNAQPLGDTLHSGQTDAPAQTPQVIDPTAPPPVPPPIPFQFNPPSPPQQ